MEAVLQRLGGEQSEGKNPKSFRYPPPVVVKRRRKTESDENEEDEEDKATSGRLPATQRDGEAPRPSSINLRRRRVIAPIHKNESHNNGRKPADENREQADRKPQPPPILIPDTSLPQSLPFRKPREKKPRPESMVLHSIARDPQDLKAALPSTERREGEWKQAKKEQRIGGKRMPKPKSQLHETTVQPKGAGMGSQRDDGGWQSLKEEQASSRPAKKKPRLLHEVGKDDGELHQMIAAISSITLEDPVTKEKKTFPVYRDEDVFGKEAAPLLHNDSEEEEEDVGEDDMPTTKAQWLDGLKRNKERVREAAQLLWCLAEVDPASLSVEKRLEKLKARVARNHKEVIA